MRKIRSAGTGIFVPIGLRPPVMWKNRALSGGPAHNNQPFKFVLSYPLPCLFLNPIGTHEKSKIEITPQVFI